MIRFLLNGSARGGNTAVQVLLVVGCVAALGFGAYRILSRTSSADAEYPYWCRKCHEVYDVSEIRKDYPKNWRIPPGAPSDSVVLCIRCDEGWAYPAATCYECGTVHVVNLWPDSRCPVCNPEVGQAAEARGIDLTPPELSD